jgi:hypothetical protein
MELTVWQQASGDTDRDYAELCIRWSVILNGPGRFGPWPACKNDVIDSGQKRKSSDLQRFAELMLDGDLVVLRKGTKEVVALGQIVGEYEWNDGFGDIDGWNIQHVRRVRWYWHNLDAPKTFDTWELKQGDTTQKLTSPVVLDWVKSIQLPRKETLLPNLPEPPRQIELNEISAHLFDHGVASASITQVIAVVDELVRVGAWYRRTKIPSEHEAVATLVVPLLRALGWTPQKIGIEWNRVDVALFQKLPRDDKNLRVVVEAKRMNLSCLSAHSQAERYAKGRNACHRLIVTDGLRYGIYRRKKDKTFTLHAYMNLARLRDEYPILGCQGAKEALLSMAPEWSSEA